MGNHAIIEPASWDATTPQVPDPGPTSYMDSAAATIEAFITILGKRTQYLKATEEVDVAALNVRVNNTLRLIQRTIETQAGANWRYYTKITGLTPQFCRSNRAVEFFKVGGAGGKIYDLISVDLNAVQIPVGSSYAGTFYDYTGDFGTFNFVAVGTGGCVQWGTDSFTTMTQSRIGGADLYTIDANPANNRFVIGGASGTLIYGTGATTTTFTNCTHPFGTAAIVAVRFLHNLWVATSSDGRVATSTDGITWTSRLTTTGSEFTRQQIFYHPVLQTWAAIGRIVSPGYDCFWATSTDGTTWVQGSSGFFSTIEIAPHGPQFVHMKESLATLYINPSQTHLDTEYCWNFNAPPRQAGFNSTSYVNPGLSNPTIITKFFLGAGPRLQMCAAAYDGTDTYIHLTSPSEFYFLNP